MKIICLDIGTKRIGVAASDSLGLTAQGITTIKRTTKKSDFAEIFKYIQELEAQMLLAGLPLDEEGRIGSSAEKILLFLEELKSFLQDRNCSIPIETWDERYSTAEAEEHLLKFDVSRKRRKEVIDKMAAVMILRDYLEAKGGG